MAERAAELAAAERRKESRRLVEVIVKNDYKDKKAKDTDPLGNKNKITMASIERNSYFHLEIYLLSDQIRR